MRFGRIVRSMLRVFCARGAAGALGIGIAVLIANRLGATAPSDAFYLVRRVTLGLTEAVRRLVVTVSVPPIVAILHANRDGAARYSWLRQIAPLFGVVTGGAILVAVLAAWVVILLAPGFDADRQKLSADLLRILVFTIPLHFALSALVSVSYAFRRFVVPELAAAIPRILTIVILFLFVPPLSVTALGWAILAGTAIGVVFLMPSVVVSLRSTAREEAVQSGGDSRLEDELPIDAREAPNPRGRIVPVVLFQGYRQVAGWLDLAFASLLVAGAVSMVEFGQRLAFVVPALLMNSFFTVFYTEMAYDAVEGGAKRLSRSVAASLRAGLFVLIPFAAFLWVAAGPMVDLVFQHGAFDALMAQQTAAITRILAPAFVLAFVMRALAMGAYADSGAPIMQVVLWMVGVGFIVRVVALSLLPSYFGVAGIPLAALASVLATCATGYLLLSRRWGRIMQPADLMALGKVLLASVLAWSSMLGLASTVDAATGLGQFFLLVAVGVSGAAVYVLATLLLRVEEARRFFAVLRRRRDSSSV